MATKKTSASAAFKEKMKRERRKLEFRGPQRHAQAKFKRAEKLLKTKPEEAHAIYKALGLATNAARAKLAAMKKITTLLEKNNFEASARIYYLLGDEVNAAVAYAMGEQHKRATLGFSEGAYGMAEKGARELANAGFLAEGVEAQKRKELGPKAQLVPPDPLGSAAKLAAADILENIARYLPQNTPEERGRLADLGKTVAKLRSKRAPRKRRRPRKK